MAKQLLILLVFAALVGGVYFLVNYDVQRQYVGGRPVGWRVVQRGAAAPGESGGGMAQLTAVEQPARPTLRIVTFQLGRFDEAKLSDRRVSDVLMRLLPRFDLIALQGIHGRNQGVLVRLVEQLNLSGSGRLFDFATCPTQQRDALERYSVFLFDSRRVEVDRSTVHFVEDRSGRLRGKPLVGSFRARGPDPAEAFTFTLINVDTDPDRAAVEVDLLADVFRAVRDDGRGEDDIILLGDLENDDQHLGQLGKLLGIGALVSGVPTTARGAHLLDNILLNRWATREFTGRVEVVDMMREYELTLAGAQAVSEHLPVWAEFSAYEGGQPGHPMAIP